MVAWLFTIVLFVLCWEPPGAEAEPSSLPLVDARSTSLETFPVSTFEDPSATLSPTSLVLGASGLRSVSHFSLGYTRSAWWVVFRLSNPGNDTIERILHDDDGFMIDHLDEFEQGEGAWEHRTEGIFVPASAKYLPDSGAVFPISLGPRETKTVYLRFKTKSPLLVSLSLYDLGTYQQTRVERNIFLAVIFGALLVMLLSSFFLFWSLRSLEYLYYVVYLVGASVYISVQTGFAVEHFGVFGEARSNLFYSVYVVAVSLLLFSRMVLETRTRTPGLDRAILVFLVLNLGGILGGLVFGLQNTLFIQTPLILVSSIFLLGVGVGAQVARTPTAKYFIPATGTFLLSTAVASLLFLGPLPYNFWTRNSYFLGIVIEAVLLSLLLSYRIQLLRQDKLQAQERILALESKAREELEVKVAERTRELAEAVERAEALALTDSITGLKNRRAFFEEAGVEFLRAQRHGRDLCVLMIDLDHFKAINDQYGHGAGDEVLRVFSDTLAQASRRSDIVARIGGEEFAVVLPETNADQAEVIAQRIRWSVEAERVRFRDSEVKFTASLGLAALTEGDAAVSDLLARADEALYRAKSEGRNRVSR